MDLRSATMASSSPDKLSSQLHLCPPLSHQRPSSLALPRLHKMLGLHISGIQHRPLSLTLSCIGRGNNKNIVVSGGGGGGGAGYGGGRYGGGGGGSGYGGSSDRNREEALFVLAQAGRKLESLPADLASAVEAGRVTGEIMRRFLEMEGWPLHCSLLHFEGFTERLLADNLFAVKVAVECGVGVIAKTAAEYDKRNENFVKEIDTVISDVVVAVAANFMLAYLPAPTVSLHPPLGINARLAATLSQHCPDITFQIALAARLYLLVDRLGQILRISPKIFAVKTSASLVDTGVTDALVTSTKAVVKELDDKVEIPSVPAPDKVEEKNWWSYFEAGAELSAGLIAPKCLVDGFTQQQRQGFQHSRRAVNLGDPKRMERPKGLAVVLPYRIKYCSNYTDSWVDLYRINDNKLVE